MPKKYKKPYYKAHPHLQEVEDNIFESDDLLIIDTAGDIHVAYLHVDFNNDDRVPDAEWRITRSRTPRSLPETQVVAWVALPGLSDATSDLAWTHIHWEEEKQEARDANKD